MKKSVFAAAVLIAAASGTAAHAMPEMANRRPECRESAIKAAMAEDGRLSVESEYSTEQGFRVGRAGVVLVANVVRVTSTSLVPHGGYTVYDVTVDIASGECRALKTVQVDIGS